MNRQPQERGFTLLEALVSLAVIAVIISSFATVMVQNSRLNKARQMAIDAQSTARNSMNLIVQTLRSAGWDPQETGFTAVALDPDTTDAVNFIEVYADLDEDGSTDGDGEQVLIRHANNRIEWRRSNDTTQPFQVLGVNVTNDANGDGTPELMFVPDSTTNPTRIVVTITTESPVPDPQSGLPIRYTVSSEVVLRKRL